MPQFYTLLTDTGQAKLANAVALGGTIEITELAIGDGNGSLPAPDSSAVALVNEVRRAPINASQTDPDNPSWILVEQVLPPDVGGWTIREIGIYDVDDDLIGIGNYPETYKPVLAEGSSRTQTVRFVLEVSDTSAVTLKVDPSVVLATREYVDDQRADHEQDPEAHTDDQIPLSATVAQAPNATDVAEALAALGAFAADGYQNIAVFDAPGTTDWAVPDVLQNGLRKAHVTVYGAGGGGGRGVNGGGGGGGGGASIGTVDLSGISSVSITVGGGGAGASNDNTSGDGGGSSSFGSILSATGGGGGTYQGNSHVSSGVGSGGDINFGLGGGSQSNVRGSGDSGVGGDGGGIGHGTGGASGRSAYGHGAGGGGAVNDGVVGGTGPGGNGGDGIVIVRY